MARPARFDENTILDAALQVVAVHGPHAETTEAVASHMGGHAGSIYYRFPTKDHLLAALWMRSILLVPMTGSGRLGCAMIQA